MKHLSAAVLFVAALTPAISLSEEANQPSRDYLVIVGSTTVKPFANRVAGKLVADGRLVKPLIQASGTGGGLMLFCHGTGVLEPDVALASRRIKSTEWQRCVDNGVEELVEIQIGHDGIVLAGSDDSLTDLTLRELYLGLARQVPEGPESQQVVTNPNRRWSDIDARLPSDDIRVLGPSGGSGTHYIFRRLGLEAGCRTFAAMRELKREEPLLYRQNCRVLRDDSGYVAAGENDNATLSRLEKDPGSLGVFSYGFVEQNADTLHPVSIDGVAPGLVSIADDSYPLSRPLYIYAKKQHLEQWPAIQVFVNAMTSEDAVGATGYLLDEGLVPLPAAERSRYRDIAEQMEVMASPG